MSSSGDSFTEKTLSFTFTLGQGSFGNTGAQNLTVSNCRASVSIENAGGQAMPRCDARIYGMNPKDMNALSTLGLVATTWRRNLIAISAGNKGGALSQIFIGTIVDAYGDYSRQPDVPFAVTAATGYIDRLNPSVAPTSYDGNADVATMLKQLASQCIPPLTFKNYGVQQTLRNVYYPGPPRVQIEQIIYHAGIDWNGGENGILAIWPPGQFRNTDVVPLIAPPPAGSMIGYPSFFSLGLRVRNLFNPNIKHGSLIQVQSSQDALKAVNKQWGVAKINLELESLMPGGKWEVILECAPPGFVAPT